MILTNMNNKIEKTHEETARATVAGFAAGKIAQKTDVIHLLTEYNDLTGLELTATTVMQPENYKAFTQWAFSRLANLSDMLTEYSSLYQTNTADGVFLQHSPKSAQRVYLNSMFMHQTNMMALADTYHDNFLRLAGDVDMHSSPKAREAILDGLKQKMPLLVELSKVSYMDSSGVASLVEGYQTAKKQGLEFALLAVAPSAMNVLKLARLDKVFPIHASLAECLKGV